MEIGLDIGGANLKAAAADGRAASVPFPLWRDPDGLAAQLARLIAPFGTPDVLAVTMTGELADCFATKAEGVDRILAGVERIAGFAPVRVWTTAGRFVTPVEARQRPLEAAAANWHAQATWAGSLVPRGACVLIDIGSTTTDIIPIVEGLPCPAGRTDPERLQTGELVYRGVRRTPLMAVSPVISTPDRDIPAAAEQFATLLDVFLILGDLPEDERDCDTANGRPATRAAAHDRLARMTCCDRTEFPWSDAVSAAAGLAELVLDELSTALTRVVSRLGQPLEAVLISGSGEFFARRVVERALDVSIVAFSQRLSSAVAEAACAFAVAQLARNEPSA